MLIHPSFLSHQLIDELYVGAIAQELVTGLKMPFTEYRADNYAGGSLVIRALASGFFLLFGPTVFALKLAPLEKCTDQFHFDTQVLIQFKENGLQRMEIPVPTHYGPESHQVGFWTSMRYGLGILVSLLEYRLHASGIRRFRSSKFSG